MPRIVLGITGSFGSGKSTVAALFRSLGAKVIDADKLAHALISPGKPAYKKIIRVFGKGVLKKNKAINRNLLAEIVFGNKELLSELNRIVHPQVIRLIKGRIKASQKKVVILDAPLLIEAGLTSQVDKLIVVKARKEAQVKRVKAKSVLSKPDILKRIKAQIPLSDKVRRADFVIDNNGTKENTKKEVLRIWRSLWKN